ncbi:MAG: chemotaxis response regulator CheY [Deltaproteobacteria bacterium]|nr:chemotaxis response regulator CheY [Deltaproteobacteria bacterium]
MSSALNSVDRKLKILVVDDFATMRRIVRTCLQQLGFTNVAEAEDGQIALSKLTSGDFQLVISDWNMPNMMGIDLLKAVRANDKLRDLPFIMVTAEGLKENVMEAIKSGVSNYVVKPFTAEGLQTKLEQVFKKQQQQAAAAAAQAQQPPAST